MMFSGDELMLYEFYESLSDVERDDVDRKLINIIDEMRKNGITEGEIYDLKCIVAKDLYKDDKV